MDESAQVEAYAAADFSSANALFIQQILERIDRIHPARSLLDLGCGPADISFDIARQLPATHVTALDGSSSMLAFAAETLARQPDIEPRISLHHACLPDSNLPPGVFDIIVSNSMLHHLHNPADFWQTITSCGRPGALVVVMDLFRPESRTRARQIVDENAADEADILQEDFFNSLLAAFTPEEVSQQLADAGLPNFEISLVSERHFCATGQLPENG